MLPWTAVAETRWLLTALPALWLARSRGELALAAAGLTLVAIALHARCLYGVTRQRLASGLPPSEQKQDAWHGAALDSVNAVRLGVGTVVLRLVELVVDLINLCMPAPIKFYVHSVPCTDMGEGVAMGVAYFVYPGGGSHEEMAKQQAQRRNFGIQGGGRPAAHKPTTFVCNVGHMDQGGKDWVSLGFSTMKMSASLKTRAAARDGFCGQYLVEFQPKNEKKVRQLNLTAWASDAAAHDWYVGNSEHRRIVEHYRSGHLGSFSAMLARLHVAGGAKPKFHVRCYYCRALITGYPEQSFCKECGWEAQHMPLF